MRAYWFFTRTSRFLAPFPSCSSVKPILYIQVLQFPTPHTRHPFIQMKRTITYRHGSHAWRIRFAGRSDIEALSMKCAKRLRSFIYHDVYLLIEMREWDKS